MNRSNNRVVITGMGAIAPNGIGKEKFWESVLSGKSGIKRISSFDVSRYPCQIAGEITDFDPSEFVEPRLLKRSGRAVHLAVAATKIALEDAGLSLDSIDRDNTGIILGMGCPPIDVIARDVGIFLEKGYEKLMPYELVAEDNHSAANSISNYLGTRNLVMTISTGCTAGLVALGLAVKKIKDGDAHTVICGGVDAPVSPFSFAVFSAAGIMSQRNNEPDKASRPFDKERDGGILSEGAGILVAEELEHAVERGARAYGEIIGFGSVNIRETIKNDKRNKGAGDGRDGFVSSMKQALVDAEIEPDVVDYIAAHGSSDPEFDILETKAIKRVFGRRAYCIPASSIKSTIGNPIAAAGPLQVIVIFLAMRDGKIPPTINYEFPDPECDLDYVPNQFRYNNVNVGLANSHGIGGDFATLIVKRYTG